MYIYVFQIHYQCHKNSCFLNIFLSFCKRYRMHYILYKLFFSSIKGKLDIQTEKSSLLVTQPFYIAFFWWKLEGSSTTFLFCQVHFCKTNKVHVTNELSSSCAALGKIKKNPYVEYKGKVQFILLYVYFKFNFICAMY